jgi:DNA-directed RNA polymerase specialized sigma24 family protein
VRRIAQPFPATSWDLLADASSRGRRSAMAQNEFADRYYAAIRAFIAAIVRDDRDVDDLTQRFFETAVISGRLLAKADREKGAFRPYLKQSIRNFLVDERRRLGRIVRAEVRPDAAEAGWDTVASTESAPDEAMLRAWAQSLVGVAISKLKAACDERGQGEHFELFTRRYLSGDDAPPNWRDIGARFGLEEKIARSRADTAARRFRVILREMVAGDVGSDARVDEELRQLMALL